MQRILTLIFLMLPCLSGQASAFFFKSVEYRLATDPLSVSQVRNIFDDAANLSDAELEIRFVRYYEQREKRKNEVNATSIEISALMDLSTQSEAAWESLAKCEGSMLNAAKTYRTQPEVNIRSRCPDFNTVSIRQNIRNFVSSSNHSINFNQELQPHSYHPFLLQIVFEEMSKDIYPLSQDGCDVKKSGAHLRNCFFVSIVASDVFKVKYQYEDYTQLITKYKDHKEFQILYQSIGLWALSRILAQSATCDQLGLWPGINSYMLDYNLRSSWFISSLEINLNYISSYKYRLSGSYKDKGCVNGDLLKKALYTSCQSMD